VPVVSFIRDGNTAWSEGRYGYALFNYTASLADAALTVYTGGGAAAAAKGAGSGLVKGGAKGGVKAAGKHSVYHGLDAAGKVKYVGITGRQPAIRFAEHAASGTAKSTLRYRVVDGATGLTEIQARVWEQMLINQHGLSNLHNIRNSIASKHWWQYGITYP
jgi:hypothetical protein